MNVLMLLGGLASTIGATALLAMVVVSVRGERAALGRSLAAVAGTGASTPVRTPRAPLSQRLVLPMLESLSSFGRAISPGGAVERLVRQLDLAGNPAPWTLERVLGIKVLAAVAGALLSLWMTNASELATVLLVAGPAALVGLFLPDVLVYNAGTKRQARIQKTLPDAIDLLTVGVEAGLGFDAALTQMARNIKGPLSGEFFRVLQEMQLGKSRAQSLRALTERTTVSELRSFASAMVQADSLGIPIGKVLREQAKEMRLKRRQRAEEQAMKVPVKIMAPMVILIMPVIFVIILGPTGFVLARQF